MSHDLPTFAEVCRALLAVESIVTCVLAVLLALSASIARSRQARVEVRLVRGRAILARLLAADEHADDLETLRALPKATRIALILEFAPSLAGRQRERLSSVGALVGISDHAESLCRSRFWWRRLRGARLATALDHDADAMRPLLRDRSSVVRAQVLVWAAGRDDNDVIDELVRHLGDPEHLCRFTVQDSLLRLGNPAASALVRYFNTLDTAGLEDALAVAKGLAQPELLQPALSLAQHESDRVRAHAVALLGVLGGEASVRILGERLHDASPLVRAAAAHATGELGYWQASSDLARLLGDPSWPVRRESALALRRMGGAGQLSLRRALRDENPFAADMARQVLDLPDPVYNRIAV